MLGLCGGMRTGMLMGVRVQSGKLQDALDKIYVLEKQTRNVS